MSNPITRTIIRPLFNLLDDFWFYGFHPVLYPDFVEIFTKEIDLLNELKIKPDFLDVELEANILTNTNNWTIKAQETYVGAPPTIFMLESVKDIYTMNLAMSVVQFFALLLFKLLFYLIKG